MTSQHNALIELLCNHHCAPGRKAELSCGILLEGTRRKRRRRFLAAFALLDFLDLKFLRGEIVRDLCGLLFAVQRRLFSTDVR